MNNLKRVKRESKVYLIIYKNESIINIIMIDHLAEMTKSSILSIILTHSVVRVSALSVISVG